MSVDFGQERAAVSGLQHDAAWFGFYPECLAVLPLTISIDVESSATVPGGSWRAGTASTIGFNNQAFGRQLLYNEAFCIMLFTKALTAVAVLGTAERECSC